MHFIVGLGMLEVMRACAPVETDLSKKFTLVVRSVWINLSPGLDPGFETTRGPSE
jgi:hypothetical protein